MSVALRPLDSADATTFASWEADTLFCARAGWQPSASEDLAAEWWRSQIRQPDPRLLRLAAVHREQCVGYVDLYDDEAEGRELGVNAAQSLFGLRWT